MIEQYFNDDRHRKSEEAAFLAERAERQGKLDDARRGYAEAATLEEAVARTVPGDLSKPLTS